MPNIEDLNVFDLTASGSIQSDNFVTGTSGYRLTKVGVEFAAGVLGDLASTNFQSGSQGWRLEHDGGGELNDVSFRGNIQSSNFSAGSSGWRFLSNGSAELDAAAIRGTLSADHIDSDVINAEVLINYGTASSPRGQVNSSSNRDFDIQLPTGTTVNDWSVLQFTMHVNAWFETWGVTSIPVSAIRRPVSTTTNYLGSYIFVGSIHILPGGGDDDAASWSVSCDTAGTRIYMNWRGDTNLSSDVQYLHSIIGLRNPGSSTTPVDPDLDPATTAPGVPTNLRGDGNNIQQYIPGMYSTHFRRRAYDIQMAL